MDFLTTLDRNNDDYTTPCVVWEQISQYLPRGDGQIVWEAFYNPHSESADSLRSLGCNVIYGDMDFFAVSHGTHIITNPPFSCKEKVFQRLHELQLPFIVIIPSHSLCSRYIKRFFKNELQLIIPDKRIHFEKTDNVTGKRITLKRTPFDTIYVCWKMGLPNDLIWL